ncbi:uncharacterized protein MELLADRAFT_93961 [Melampsora larici-populina 98AG31]|uniref:Uncharacterized protein n=1 Tax=Melampsora larici-populina (strain 98AG31 / pathotype 3-4-7) TaxID=747676 RepID=F4S5W9_MELLP|nr:uncharacterized protein MELLADRAFT_93961 [Melampsora larici-populina 98AG31]EGF99974.1 hypothetical protein MELLADRAFT_93961 [Melampsora larici-populina 98AG31]
MGVWDSFHLVPTTPTSYAESSSHLAGPRNSAFYQHDVSSLGQKYTTSKQFDALGSSTASTSNIPTSFTGHITLIDNMHAGEYDKSSVPGLNPLGQGNPGVFDTHDGLVVDRWPGDEGLKRSPMYQEVEEATQSRISRPASLMASPGRDIHMSNPPPSDAHTDKLEDWSWLGDLLESDEWNALEARKSSGVLDDQLKTLEMSGKVSPEHGYAPHRQLFQDDVFETLPDLLSIPAFNEHNHDYLSSAHMSLSTDPHHAITATGSPVGNTALYEDTNSMSLLESSFPPPISVHSLGGALQHEDIRPSSFYEGITGIKSASKAPQVTGVLTPHDHIQKKPAFSNAPRTEFSQSSSDHRILNAKLIRSPESQVGHNLGQSHNFENFLESQTFHEESKSNSHDVSSQLHPLSVSPPVSNDLENFGTSFDHFTHGIDKARLRSVFRIFANYSSQDSPITIDTLLHELNSLPPLDDLPNFDEFTLDPHKISSSLSEQNGVTSERSPSSSLDNEARSHLAESDIEKSDDIAGSRPLEWLKTASSRPFQWRKNGDELDRDTSAKSVVVLPRSSDEQDLDQDNPMTTSQNTKPPSQDALASSSKSGQLKGPSQTYQVESQPSKRKSPHDPFSFDEDDGPISQVKLSSTSADTRFHNVDSSTRSSLPRSWRQSKPQTVLEFDSERNSGFEKPLNTILKNPVDFETQPVNYRAKKKSRKNKDLPSKATYPQREFNLDFNANHVQKLALNSKDKPRSPRALIDTFQPRIQKFKNRISKREPDKDQSKHLTENLGILFDNYLEMIAICSEIVSPKVGHTNLQQDLLDAYMWLSEKWVKIPKTKFYWYPVRKTKFPPQKSHADQTFSTKFDSLPVYEGTVFWLNHKLYNPRREHVAAEYAIRFMRENREDWIELIIRRPAKVLTIRGLLSSMRKVRPLKYPGPARSESSKPRLTSRKKRQGVV